MTTATKNIIHKLETLPENMVNEVEDFIDFLKAKHSKNFSKSQDDKKNKVEEPKSLYGAAKGTIIYISDDFNEPLEDLKDYVMRFLIDTHIFLFFINGEKSIPKEVIEIINNKNAEKFISIVSLWEIIIKISIGKLKLKDDITSIYNLLNIFGIKIIYPAENSFKAYLTLPLIHKDPFDMIISQALADDLILITDDQYIKNYPNLKLF